MNAKQSHLPIPFTSGSPTSLEYMSLSQLQRYLMFLLKCEQGCDVITLADLKRPIWWPPDVEYQDELLGKNLQKGLWSCKLRKVIQKCYKHHGASFILDFSKSLMAWIQRVGNKFLIEDIGEGTRALKNAKSGTLIVTFKSENQDYDKCYENKDTGFTTHSPMKNGFSLSSQSNVSDHRLPICADLYLCDICGKDFESLKELLPHEKSCESRRSETNRNDLFGYLNLVSSASGSSTRTSARVGSQTSPTNVVRPRPANHAKFLSIDISSPLGCYITELTKSNCDKIDIKLLCVPERKNPTRSGQCGPSIKSKKKKDGYPVTYKGPRDKRALKQSPHEYCFNAEDRLKRRLKLRRGLSDESLKLYKKISKIQVRVKLRSLKMTDDGDVCPEQLQKLLERYKGSSIHPRIPHKPSKAPSIEDNGFTSMLPFMQKLEPGTNSFYRNMMYGQAPPIPNSNTNSSSSSNSNSDSIQYIDLSSDEDDSAQQGFDFGTDRNLALAIRQVPAAAAAVLRVNIESDPLGLI